jgi:crotonobetaine/carnitine-CoA ligase
MVPAFDTASFWQVVREAGITVCALIGSMATFLVKQDQKPDDADSPLRMVIMAPLVGDAPVFAKRFGVTIYTMFGSTEISCPLISGVNPTVNGTCGRARRGMEVRLVDEHDREVPTGEIGELMVRGDLPWSMTHGYHRMPDATAAAWRNGWFHTGDAFRRDADGNFFFVDRVKDYIRRRGENISSFEVEAELLAFPKIGQAAAVGVRSEFGEDEVLAVVAPVEGAEIQPAQLIDFLVPRMPHFMVPRYIRVVADLPRTPTNKVQKHVLREEGITEDTWDREKAGIRLHRDRVGET